MKIIFKFLTCISLLLIINTNTLNASRLEDNDRAKLKPNKVVLTFDGGGGRGLISAIILKEIEDHLPGKNIHHYVTHFAGNSTGSILAAGLASGKSVSDMINFYMKDGPEIFSNRARNKTYPLFNTKYDRTIFDAKLNEGFGEVCLGNLTKGLIVMADQLETSDQAPQGPVIFNSDDESQKGFLLKDICAGSCSAPSIFPPYTGMEGYKLVDGGILENHPGMTTYTLLKERGTTLNMISIGTGHFANIYDYNKSGIAGIYNWLTSLPHLITRDTGVLSDHNLKSLVKKRYVRFNPDLKEYVALDEMTPEALERLQLMIAEYISVPAVRDQIVRTAMMLTILKNQGLVGNQLDHGDEDPIMQPLEREYPYNPLELEGPGDAILQVD